MPSELIQSERPPLVFLLTSGFPPASLCKVRPAPNFCRDQMVGTRGFPVLLKSAIPYWRSAKIMPPRPITTLQVGSMLCKP
jgi:hypothetical protein